MEIESTRSEFKTKILRPANSGDEALKAFVVLPKSASDKLPRRGRTTIEGTINGHGFRSTLEPDGQLSHWLALDKQLFETAGVDIGEIATFEIRSVNQEPEPDVPADFEEALAANSDALAVWKDTTTIARVDWIHWIVTAKQAKTRAKRIRDACDKLASGKRRVCCFDPSGFYSKALGAPKTAE
ncbi:MAG: YdeI/OmpD-associated family protein [Pseudohongiella sp.]|nr:YdeI/OmpD-associated family protein [Pseudohongiella sp.]